MASGQGGSEDQSQGQVFAKWKQDHGDDGEEVTSKATQGASVSEAAEPSAGEIVDRPAPGNSSGAVISPWTSGNDPVEPNRTEDAQGESSSFPARPTDEDIVRQQNIIMEEQAKNSPLVGSIEPLSGMETEYKNGNEVFVEKLQYLQKDYSGVRRVRRDGNCFFRGFIFGYIESLLVNREYKERDRMTKHLETCKDKLLAASFQDLVFEDALGIVQEKVSEVGHPTKDLSLEVWELVMRDDQVSNYVVMFLRLLTSAEIQLNKDSFLPFIMGISEIMDVELFCQSMVEVMNEESEEIHIKALTDALKVSVRVYSLDSRSPVELTPADYVPENCPTESPLVHLLYRPGHYDILYPKGRQTVRF
ncbi:hypothetical protein BSKO_13832 [Bryopsis sp. KO-2023]|nr:hypothetical protein BSKO_13832 [Bryopsis sp. KO-2023]